MNFLQNDSNYPLDCRSTGDTSSGGASSRSTYHFGSSGVHGRGRGRARSDFANSKTEHPLARISGNSICAQSRQFGGDFGSKMQSSISVGFLRRNLRRYDDSGLRPWRTKEPFQQQQTRITCTNLPILQLVKRALQTETEDFSVAQTNPNQPQ